MNNRLRVRLIRERAHGWMTDNVHPRVDCQDLTELCKQPFPKEKRWITSDQVTPKLSKGTK